MRKTLCTMAALAMLAGGMVWAEKKEESKDSTRQPTTKPVNTNCAVMNEHPVDDRVTIQHEGKTIGFCCEDCIPTFKENPQKYVEKMK